MNKRIPGLKLTWGKLMAQSLLVFLVAIWTIPSLGLLISSLRDKDQLIVSGWWTALQTSEGTERGRTGAAKDQIERDGKFVIEGSFFEPGSPKSVKTFGDKIKAFDAFQAGESITFDDDSVITVNEDGTYQWVSSVAFEHKRGKRIFYVATIPPIFTLANYAEVLSSEGIGQSFINTLTVANTDGVSFAIPFSVAEREFDM